MSTRQAGNATENLAIAYLEEKHGYFCYPSRGSRGVDVVALSTTELPHLLLEVGTKNKRARGAFAKMEAQPNFPGAFLLVVRKIKVKGRNLLRWHVPGIVRGLDDFTAAIAAVRSV
jgi:hypothetical protein